MNGLPYSAQRKRGKGAHAADFGLHRTGAALTYPNKAL
jgi:hypothetical protein